MSNGIFVQHAALDQGADDVLRVARGIQSRLDVLESELGPLRSTWTGQAKSAYDDAKRDWDRAMGEMILILENVSKGVREANKGYFAADKGSAGCF